MPINFHFLFFRGHIELLLVREVFFEHFRLLCDTQWNTLTLLYSSFDDVYFRLGLPSLQGQLVCKHYTLSGCPCQVTFHNLSSLNTYVKSGPKLNIAVQHHFSILNVILGLNTRVSEVSVQWRLPYFKTTRFVMVSILKSIEGGDYVFPMLDISPY